MRAHFSTSCLSMDSALFVRQLGPKKESNALRTTSEALHRFASASCLSLIPSASGRRAVMMCLAGVLIGSLIVSDFRFAVNKKSNQFAYDSKFPAR